MNRGIFQKRTKRSFGNILYWTVGTLFMLTMLSVWLVSGLYAKYLVSDTTGDSARVAGGGQMAVLEHEAYETYENSGVYDLHRDDNHLVPGNAYEKVLPGVDIPKDPFVRVNVENAEVDYELYIKVIPSADFPKTVTYTLTDMWLPVVGQDGVYKYNGYFDAGSEKDNIPILKDDTLYVSQYFVGKGDFSLSFEAWLKQVD